MAKDLDAFRKRLEEDSAFAEEFKKIGDRIKKDEENLREGEILFRAAKELDYEFTHGDIDRYVADEQELDDDELAMASGGGISKGGLIDMLLSLIGNSNWCMKAAYHCAIWDN